MGGGGREHALAWRLAQSPLIEQLIASPGNPGIAEHALCVPASPNVEGYADLAEAHRVDLTVVGPEAPLVAGIVDRFAARGLKIIGPTQAAARLEGSKVFAKQFFGRAGIPTARSIQTDRFESSQGLLQAFGLPVVIKADGLAGGKGVRIVHTAQDAEEAIRDLGPSLVIEEFLEGEEVSFIGLSDGLSLVPFAPAQDHKAAFDDDQGPNTGGMGAYCDTRILTSAQSDDVMDRIMLPAIHTMRSEGAPFTGFLYAGLMMTGDGPKVLEFNVRLGDPETQALLFSLEGDLAYLLETAANGVSIPAPRWGPPSLCVVLSAAGYPGTPKSGDEITGIADAERSGAKVFQAGTRQEGSKLVTSGGRVLGVTASGNNLQTAIDRSYRAIHEIKFDGMHFRRDIGRKGLRRW